MIQNRKSDFYALIKFLKFHPFDDINIRRRWVGPDTEEATHRLQVITTTLMLRGTKAELIAKGAIHSLPERRFDLIEVDLDPEEKVLYQKLLLYSRTFLLLIDLHWNPQLETQPMDRIYRFGQCTYLQVSNLL